MSISHMSDERNTTMRVDESTSFLTDYHTFHPPQDSLSPSISGRASSSRDLWRTVKRRALKKHQFHSIALQVRARSLRNSSNPRVNIEYPTLVKSSREQVNDNQTHDLETQLPPLLSSTKPLNKIKTIEPSDSSTFPHSRISRISICQLLSSVQPFLWNDTTISLIIFNIFLLIIASIFFYVAKNPVWTLLSAGASVSWWILFVIRINLTRCISLCTQYWILQALFFDDVTRRKSRKRKRALVSHYQYKQLASAWIEWMKFVMKQSQGWPFICILWGLWTYLLMYGSNPFTQNWLFFTGWSIFSPEYNSDHNILQDSSFLRVIVSTIIAGMATVVKRMYFALYLGKRMYGHFYPHVRALTQNMQLISELAEFSHEDLSEFNMIHEGYQGSQGIAATNTLDESSDEDSRQSEEVKTSEEKRNHFLSSTIASVEHSESDPAKSVESDSESSTDAMANLKVHPTSSTRSMGFSVRQQNASGFHFLKNKLDRWNDPVHITDTNEPSFLEIFLLREALSAMEDPHPFSASFGLADTRDHCMKSAMQIYRNLLRFTPSESDLPFETIAALSYELNEAGSYMLNEEKLKLLRSLFRPDNQNRLSIIAFTQSADTAYKKLIYLRASMANSIRIDLGLLFVVLTILEYDTRTLLVTVSTVVLSVAFAIGTSISKYVEGIFFIAVRRPFDIGDRISIVGTNETNVDTLTIDTWIVEDIDLMTSTLRLSSTNEVCTVDNYAIAGSRIINHNRSPNALLHISIRFLLQTTQEQIEQFHRRVQKYAKERPRIWQHVVNLRQNKFDIQVGWIEYILRVQHMKSWQDKTLILTDKTELVKFCQDEANRMGIIYLGSHP